MTANRPEETAEPAVSHRAATQQIPQFVFFRSTDSNVEYILIHNSTRLNKSWRRPEDTHRSGIKLSGLWREIKSNKRDQDQI